jgi:hypothetical protein
LNGRKTCNGAWHGTCFVQDAADKFPVLQVQDLDDSLVDESTLDDEDPNRFKEARDGDHLMTPFQCPECHFMNITGRLPSSLLHKDVLAMTCIKRATLDSLWSRERSTVQSNKLEGAKFLAGQRLLGFDTHCFPYRGPYPKYDACGMQLACSMLLRSLDPGRTTASIQYETVRKQRSFYSNFVHTCHDGMGATFVKDDGSGASVSNSKTNQPWFKKFMRGVHRRMGDVWLPDRAMSQYEIAACFKLLDARWLVYELDVVGRKKTATTACILIAGYYAALRGEEINRVDLGGMRKYWNEAVSHSHHKHIPLMLAGRFKKEIGTKLFCQPLASVTKSGRKIQLWFARMIKLLADEERYEGPMFSNKAGKRMSISEMDEFLHAVLIGVQKNYTNVIGDSIKIHEEFSAYRSLRRGATSEAQNVGIPKEVIESNNRWRKFSRAKGMTPGMSMMERYSDAKVAVPSLIRFSSELP